MRPWPMLLPLLEDMLAGLRARFVPAKENVVPAAVARPIDDAGRALLERLKNYLEGDDLRAARSGWSSRNV